MLSGPDADEAGRTEVLSGQGSDEAGRTEVLDEALLSDRTGQEKGTHCCGLRLDQLTLGHWHRGIGRSPLPLSEPLAAYVRLSGHRSVECSTRGCASESGTSGALRDRKWMPI